MKLQQTLWEGFLIVGSQFVGEGINDETFNEFEHCQRVLVSVDADSLK